MNPKPPSSSGVLPFRGEINDATRISVLRKVNFDIPQEAFGRIQLASKKIKELIDQQGALSIAGARAVHAKSRDTLVQSIVSDVNPTVKLSHLESITLELEEKRQVLVDAQGKLFLSVVDDVVDVGAAIVKALSGFADLLEEEERITAGSFSIGFEPSTQLRLVQSVAILAERRFTGIRQTIERQPALLGTPISLFVDLLPNLAD